MESSGLRPGQLQEVRGFADRRLRNPQNPLDFQNRRVSIIVMFQDRHQAKTLEGLEKLKVNLSGPSAEAALSEDLAPPPVLGQPLQEELEKQFKPLKPRMRLGW